MDGLSREIPAAATLLAALLALLLAALLPGGPGAAAGPRQELEALLGRWPHMAPTERERAEARATRLLARESAAGLALYRESRSVRERAALLRWMSLSGHPAYLEAIHHTLARGPRELAAPALAAAYTYDHPASTPYVLPYLEAAEPALTVAALRYAAGHPAAVSAERLWPLLRRTEPPVQAALLQVLAHKPRPPFRSHCRRMLEAGPALLRRLAVRCVAGQGHAAALPALLQRFGSSEPAVQAEIVRAVARLRGRDAVPHLLAWLGHPRAEVALAALLALQGMESRRAVPVLLAQLREGPRALPEETLIKSLGLFGDPRALPFLGARLRETDDPARQALLLEALGDLGALEGQRHVVGFLSHPQPGVRQAARRALRRLGAAAGASAGRGG